MVVQQDDKQDVVIVIIYLFFKYKTENIMLRFFDDRVHGEFVVQLDNE